MAADGYTSVTAATPAPAAAVAQGSNAVKQRNKQMEEASKPYEMIRALLGGTAAMRDKSEKYLPKYPGEEAASFQVRLGVSVLVPLFKRTIEVLASKPFSEPIVVDEEKTPKTISDLFENIDNQGTPLQTFAGSLAEDALSFGFGGILVDAPAADQKPADNATGAISLKTEKELNIRPYFVQVRAQDILGWKTEVIAGVARLKQLRILECVKEDDGEFAEKDVEQVRVLEPGKWATYRKSAAADANGKEVWAKHKEGVTTLTYIPFVPFYGKKLGFMKGESPMLDVAFMNVQHWQSKSDQDNIIKFARIPILAGEGMDPKSPIVIGSATAVGVPLGGSLKYVEHTGKSIECGAKALEELEDDMRQAGAELLVIKPGNTSIPQTLADNEPGTCALQRITRDINGSLNAALKMFAELSGDKSATPKVSLFDDFGMKTIAEASGELLLKLNMAGKISNETLFTENQARGIIDADLTWEDEQERILQQGGSMGALGDGTTKAVKKGATHSVVQRPDGFYVIDNETGEDAAGPFATQPEADAAHAKLDGKAPAPKPGEKKPGEDEAP